MVCFRLVSLVRVVDLMKVGGMFFTTEYTEYTE